MHDWNWENWNMPMMWFVWIPLVILIVWLIMRLSNRESYSQNREESPMEILKKRYARGEVSEEEFQQQRKDLEK